jgi:hypothetical protein
LFVSSETANPIAIFDKALKERDLDAAYDAAALVKRRRQQLSLDRILRLTLRSGEAWDRRYHAAARRLLVRVMLEVEPPMLEAKKLADALAHLNHPVYATSAREGLWDCVDQLRRMKLSVDFNSLPE